MLESPRPLRVSDECVREIHLRSTLNGEIRGLPLLRRALLLAEASMASYLAPDQVKHLVQDLGFQNFQFFDRDGAQAYWLETNYDGIIVCRGTEPSEWNDIRADANALLAVAETVGRVHRGFKQEVDDLWPRIEETVRATNKKLWFTGHSLGGAMATICAGRCKLARNDSVPEELHTFGSPRVGNKRYVNYARLNYYRWVHNNDIVTRVPPTWFGYRHTGREMYFNRDSRLRELHGISRATDRLRGFVRGLARFRIDHLSDHSMLGYVACLARAVEDQEGSPLSVRTVKIRD